MKVAVTIAFEWSWQRPDHLDRLIARARRKRRAVAPAWTPPRTQPVLRQLTGKAATGVAQDDAAGALRYSAGRGMPGLVLTCWQRWRQRCALADLDDRLLDDVGISRAQATREVRKPFWEA